MNPAEGDREARSRAKPVLHMGTGLWPDTRVPSSSVLLIESNTSGTGHLFCRAIRNLKLNPVLVAKDIARYPYAAEDQIGVLHADTSDCDALGAAIRDFGAINPIAGIYSSSDYFIETASRFAAGRGLAGPDPDAVAACRNKAKQRESLANAGLPVPRFCLIRSSESSGETAAGLTYPVVVKPTEGSGSVGVKLCRNSEEMAAQVRFLMNRTHNERGLPLPPEALIEEYLDGPEYSIEVFGMEAVGITRKYLSPEPDFVEVGHDFPASIPLETGQAMKEAAIRGLSAVGLTWGPAHVELRLTAQGPVIIEINPRLAGGYIPELVRLSYGIDLIHNTVMGAVGRTPKLNATNSSYASIRFVIAQKAGALRAFKGIPEAVSLEGIADVALYRESGALVTSYGDFRDRLGHVISHHSSAEGAIQAAEAAAAMLVPEIS